MAKLNLKDSSRFCFSVEEKNLKSFYDKAIEISNYDVSTDFIIELRIDYLLGKKIDIDDIIKVINDIKKNTDKQLIATVRTFKQSGNCILDEKSYFNIIEQIYKKSKVDAIDIDYVMYKKSYDKIIDNKKTLIITYTSMDKNWDYEGLKHLYKELVKTPANVIKCEIKAKSLEDTKNIMVSAKDSINLFSDNKKDLVIIAVGRLGLLSRLVTEYTNTKIIYLTAYKYNSIPEGKLDFAHYKKYKKIIKK